MSEATPYVVRNNIEDVITNLQNASLTLFQWFYDNRDKCHFICSIDGKDDNCLKPKNM